jgi:hypothetical protein
MNIERRTSNIQHRMKPAPCGSVFGVRCSMFDVGLPVANSPGGFAPGGESSPNLL